MICGVDEAGKGSVLGPMVVAAVGTSSDDVFSDMDVKDSKLLSSERREHMFRIITKRCSIATLVIPANEIDDRRKEMSST